MCIKNKDYIAIFFYSHYTQRILLFTLHTEKGYKLPLEE